MVFFRRGDSWVVIRLFAPEVRKGGDIEVFFLVV